MLPLIFKALIALFAVLASIVLLQDLLVFPLLLRSFFVANERDPQTLPQDVESFFFLTEDGVRLEGWHLPAEGAPKGLVLIFHGNGETIESAYNYMNWMRRLGFASVSYDFRGYGRSEGWPTESGLYADVRAFRDEVKKLYPKGDLPLILFGRSLGSGLSAYYGTLERAKLHILISPYASLRRVAQERKFLKYLSPFFRYTIPTYRYLQQSTPSNMIILHGGSDKIISQANSHYILERVDCDGEVMTFLPQELGHNDILTRKNLQRVTEGIYKIFPSDK